MRVTLKYLAKLVSEKLTALKVKHLRVKAYSTRYSNAQLEGGAATIVFNVYVTEEHCFCLFAFYFVKDFQDHLNQGYTITIKPNRYRMALNDGEVDLIKI
jgi:hypothetical protein